ncbi:MAG: ABC transporter substrate-binding protein [Clostridia bacterium]|nr:ABC transporter substrate-binding protein [Clostridia bacterium]
MKKLLALVMVLAMLCTAGLAGAETIELNVAYMPNYASLWSVLTGINMGYFAEEGLNVKLVEFADGPTIIAAMESGSIDIGYIGPGAHKLCINGRAMIFALSQIGDSDHVLVSKKAGINTVQDLKGKKVGYSSGTSSEMILQYALEEAGMTMDDIQAYEMDASALVTAMMSGSIDACACWSPSTTTIINASNGDVFSLCSNKDFAHRTVTPASWIVMKGYQEKNPETVLKFTRALYKAMDFGSNPENYEQVAKWVAEQCGTDLQNALDQTGDAAWPTAAEVIQGAQDGTIEGYYKVQQDAFIASGAVEGAVPVADYVLFDVMIEAGK